MKTKKCTGNCKLEKLITEFAKKSDSIDGLKSQCKECISEYNKDFHDKYPWKRIFNDIKSRCNNLNNVKYKNYKLKKIKNFLNLKDVKFLYIRDRADSMKKPSIDRKDNDGHYTLENCEFIEHSENSGKDKKKAILQYDLKDNLIKGFTSLIEAGRELNIDASHIGKCCKEKQKTCGGFIWRYTT